MNTLPTTSIGPTKLVSSPNPTYLVSIPPKANFNVDRRVLVVNGENIGLPLDQKEVMIELKKPAGQNDVAIEDYCLTNLVRNIPVKV